MRASPHTNKMDSLYLILQHHLFQFLFQIAPYFNSSLETLSWVFKETVSREQMSIDQMNKDFCEGRTQDGAARTTKDWRSRCVHGKVSLSCISRLIFVVHKTGKFPSEEEMQDARQKLRLAKPAAGVAAAGPTQRSPQGALVRVSR